MGKRCAAASFRCRTPHDEATPDGNNSLYCFNFLTQRHARTNEWRQQPASISHCEVIKRRVSNRIQWHGSAPDRGTVVLERRPTRSTRGTQFAVCHIFSWGSQVPGRASPANPTGRVANCPPIREGCSQLPPLSALRPTAARWFSAESTATIEIATGHNRNHLSHPGASRCPKAPSERCKGHARGDCGDK